MGPAGESIQGEKGDQGERGLAQDENIFIVDVMSIFLALLRGGKNNPEILIFENHKYLF